MNSAFPARKAGLCPLRCKLSLRRLALNNHAGFSQRGHCPPFRDFRGQCVPNCNGISMFGWGITYQITKHLIFATPASLTSHNLNQTNYTEGSLHA